MTIDALLLRQLRLRPRCHPRFPGCGHPTPFLALLRQFLPHSAGGSFAWSLASLTGNLLEPFSYRRISSYGGQTVGHGTGPPAFLVDLRGSRLLALSSC